MQHIIKRAFIFQQRTLSKRLFNTGQYFYAAEVNKKILETWEIPIDAQVQMGNALMCSYSCKQFANLLRDNLAYINDVQIAYALQRINQLDLELDEHFYDTMVPLIRDYVSRFTQDHNRSLAQIVAYCGYLNVQDNKLWDLFEEKLITSRYYRYIPLDNLVEMIHGVSKSDFGSQSLFQTVELVLLKHRLALSEDNCQECIEAFTQKDYKSPILFKMLENPTADIEAEIRSHQKKLQQ